MAEQKDAERDLPLPVFRGAQWRAVLGGLVHFEGFCSLLRAFQVFFSASEGQKTTQF